MTVETYGQILDKVQADLELVNESFLTDDEYVGLCNAAVQDAYAEIEKLGLEDEYFTSDIPINLVVGQAEYQLPADMYANKIRAVIYNNGSQIYEIRKVRRYNKAVEIARVNAYAADAYYRYDLKNRNAAVGPVLILTPPSREVYLAADGVAGKMVGTVTPQSLAYMNYIRELVKIPLVSTGSLAASRATLVDIPEFYNFVFAEFKYQVAIKAHDPELEVYKGESDKYRMQMIVTLTGQVEDDATEVLPDMSHYREHS